MASIKGFLKGALPWVSTALEAEGPAGAMAANFLGKALGVAQPNPPMDELQAAFSRVTPDQLPALIVSLKSAESNFTQQMQEMGYKSLADLANSDSADRASARQRQAEMRDWTPTVLCFVFTAGYFCTLWWVCVRGVAPAMHDLCIAMLGTLTTAVVAIINYYYGASHSGDKSNQALADVAKS